MLARVAVSMSLLFVCNVSRAGAPAAPSLSEQYAFELKEFRDQVDKQIPFDAIELTLTENINQTLHRMRMELDKMDHLNAWLLVVREGGEDIRQATYVFRSRLASTLYQQKIRYKDLFMFGHEFSRFASMNLALRSASPEYDLRREFKAYLANFHGKFFHFEVEPGEKDWMENGFLRLPTFRAMDVVGYNEATTNLIAPLQLTTEITTPRVERASPNWRFFLENVTAIQLETDRDKVGPKVNHIRPLSERRDFYRSFEKWVRKVRTAHRRAMRRAIWFYAFYHQGLAMNPKKLSEMVAKDFEYVSSDHFVHLIKLLNKRESILGSGFQGAVLPEELMTELHNVRRFANDFLRSRSNSVPSGSRSCPDLLY